MSPSGLVAKRSSSADGHRGTLITGPAHWERSHLVWRYTQNFPYASTRNAHSSPSPIFKRHRKVKFEVEAGNMRTAALKTNMMQGYTSRLVCLDHGRSASDEARG